MSAQRYAFRVGDFGCIAISDGTFTYSPPLFPPPATFLFANAPEDRLWQKLREHNLHPELWGEWISPYICILVSRGTHRVLIDTGAGNLGPNTGKLRENLHAVGISPKEIDTVILTHGHPDHIGGITDTEGRLIFSDARFVMREAEWNFWTSDRSELAGEEHATELLRAIARKNLSPIKNQLDLVDDEREILPGIRTLAASGHTPGHMALAISSEGEQLLCISDAMLHPIHIEQPDWYALIDCIPEQTVGTRHRILRLATSREALVMGFHFSFPGLGRIIEKGDGWRWEPVSTRKSSSR